MGGVGVGVVLSVDQSFDAAAARGIVRAPPVPDPVFRLVVRLEKYSRSELVAEEKKSHESTLTEFLSMSGSHHVVRGLMSAMSFASVDLLSRTYLEPHIMQYAVEEAEEGLRLAGLARLEVEANVVVHENMVDGDEGRVGVVVIPPIRPFAFAYGSGSAVYPLELVRDAGEEDGGCAVCLEERFGPEETAMRLPCGHVFHRHCIVNWMHRRSNCPICRYGLP